MAESRKDRTELPGAAAGAADLGSSERAETPATRQTGDAGSIVPARDAESGQGLGEGMPILHMTPR